MNLKERAARLKTDIPAIFLCLKSKETPLIPKILAGVTVAYALSPIDLIPDFIPVLGYLDDLIILPAFIALTIHFIPKDLFEHYRREAEGMWADGKPRKWIYALPVIIIWLLLYGLLLRLFFSDCLKFISVKFKTEPSASIKTAGWFCFIRSSYL